MLTEAMAQYGSLKAVEALDGPALAERYRRDDYPGYLGQGGTLYFRVAADGHDAPLAELPLDGEWSRQLANSKGFMIWNALAREVGAETFRRVLADIVARYSTGRITWDVFLQEVNAGAKRDLSWFYAQWFDRPGVPDWRVEYDAFRNRHVLVQRSPPYRASVRVDILTSRCRPEARRIELIGMQTDLPAPKPNCGAPNYHVDPSFELIHKQ